MTASAFDAGIDREALLRTAFRITMVIVVHAAALAFFLHPAARQARELLLAPLDVRLIELTPPERQKVPPPLPSPKAAPVTAPPPIMTAAADSVPAAGFAVAPQPPAPPRELPATAPVAPRAAPVAVAEPPPSPPVPVTAARFDADYLNNPPPVYPAISRRLREEGRVLLSVRVTSQGLPEAVDIRQGSGYARLDEAALAAVRLWRFVPARRGDTPVMSGVLVPIDFRFK
jgi:protein TonB